MSLFGKKYGCQTCGMKFASEAELRQHGAMHTKAQPAAPAAPSCAACGMSFGSPVELKAHAQQHHGM